MDKQHQANATAQTVTRRDIGKCFLGGAVFGIVVAVLILAIG